MINSVPEMIEAQARTVLEQVAALVCVRSSLGQTSTRIIELLHRFAWREVAKVLLEVGLPEFDHFSPPDAEFVFVVCIERRCVEYHGFAGPDAAGGVAIPQIPVHEARLDCSTSFSERI